MTEGMSQGTMILVAIIIFGIFVVLAYFIFEDKMRTMISDMMERVGTIVGDNLESIEGITPDAGGAVE